MNRHMKSYTIAGLLALSAFVTLVLAGCGNHDQAGSSGPMTPAQIQENAKKQNQPTNSPANPGSPAANGH